MSLSTDFERLKNNPPLELKKKIVEKIANCYSQRFFREQEEKELALEIISIIAYDQETKIRSVLSESLKKCDNLPKGLALKLARDVEEVALPMLEYSSLLEEGDLVDIIKTMDSDECLSAIAKRKIISENVCLEIVEKKKIKPTSCLIANKSAIINQQVMNNIIDYHGDQEDLITHLVNRGNLPLNIVQKALRHVSENIKIELIREYQVDEAKIDGLFKNAEEDVISKQADKVDDNKILIKFIDELNKKGELNPSFIFKSLCKGYLKFFVASLAIFSKIPYKYAHKMTFEGSKGTFGNLYSKCNMPTGTFEAVYTVFKSIQEIQEASGREFELINGTGLANRLVERIISSNINIDSIPNLKYFLSLISSQDIEADELFYKLQKQIDNSSTLEN